MSRPSPEDQPEDFQDLPASGSDVVLPQEGLSSRVRRHEEVSPDDDFVSRPRLDPSVTLDRKHEHESEEAGPGSKVQRLDFPVYISMLRSFAFHPLRPSMDLKFQFRSISMKKNFC